MSFVDYVSHSETPGITTLVESYTMFSFHGSISNDNNMRLKNSVLSMHYLSDRFSQFNLHAGHQPAKERMERATRRRNRLRSRYLIMLLVIYGTVMGILAVTVM